MLYIPTTCRRNAMTINMVEIMTLSDPMYSENFVYGGRMTTYIDPKLNQIRSRLIGERSPEIQTPHLTMILELYVSVTLVFVQMILGVGRPSIRHVSLNNAPRVTDVASGGK